MNKITQICLPDLPPPGPYCLLEPRKIVIEAGTKESEAWSVCLFKMMRTWCLSQSNCSSPAVFCQVVQTSEKKKSVLVLEKIWHRFGVSQKSYMFFSTSRATTDCCVTRDHILFEHKKAMVRSLPSPINGSLNESSFTSMICKTSMPENKQTICGDTGLSAAI